MTLNVFLSFYSLRIHRLPHCGSLNRAILLVRRSYYQMTFQYYYFHGILHVSGILLDLHSKPCLNFQNTPYYANGRFHKHVKLILHRARHCTMISMTIIACWGANITMALTAKLWDLGFCWNTYKTLLNTH